MRELFLKNYATQRLPLLYALLFAALQQFLCVALSYRLKKITGEIITKSGPFHGPCGGKILSFWQTRAGLPRRAICSGGRGACGQGGH